MIFNGLLLKIYLINRKILFKLAQLKSVTSHHHLPKKMGRHRFLVMSVKVLLLIKVTVEITQQHSARSSPFTGQSMLLLHLQSRALGGDQKREVTDTRAKKDSPSTCGWALP